MLFYIVGTHSMANASVTGTHITIVIITIVSFVTKFVTFITSQPFGIAASTLIVVSDSTIITTPI